MSMAVWQKRVNTGAFLLALCCVAVFFIFGFIADGGGFSFPVHPMMLNLWMTVFVFFLGMIGFSGAVNGKRFLMSIVTLLITFFLSILLLFILVIGSCNAW